MPRQAPKLKSRNSIERRNAAEAHPAIKPTLRSRGCSWVGSYRFHLGRLGHRQQDKPLGAAKPADRARRLTPLCVDMSKAQVLGRLMAGAVKSDHTR
jgi:hypothetical protein